MTRQLKPREKFLAGRLRAVELMPYMTAAIMKMIPFEVPRGSLGTFGVTPTGVMMYDPICLEQWSVDEIADTFLHEVGHLLRDHEARCKALLKSKFHMSGLDERTFRSLWNVAGDMEINDDLLEAKRLQEGDWRLPKEIEEKDGQLAELYLNKLIEQLPPQMSGGEGDDEDEQQGGGGGGSGDGEGDEEGGGGQCKDPSKGHGGHCGSGAGFALDCEPDVKKQIDGAGRSEAEMNQVRKAVAQAIQQASTAGRGNVPAGWVRWADTQLAPPKIDWRTKLARAVRVGIDTVRGYQDFTYNRPSRRQGAYGWTNRSPIMPAMVTPVPRIAIAIDTSGSMGDQELHTAASEASGIIEATGAEISFYACDCQVHEATKVRSVEELCAQLKGGGGTSFKPVFEAISKVPEKPHVLVFITDGGGDAPAKEPDNLHTIWVLTGSHRMVPQFGEWGNGGKPWGEFIEVDDDGRSVLAGNEE